MSTDRAPLCPLDPHWLAADPARDLRDGLGDPVAQYMPADRTPSGFVRWVGNACGLVLSEPF